MKKGLIIGAGVLVAAFLGYRVYSKMPGVVVNLKADGSGTVTIGNKTASFPKGQGVTLSSWNGYEISVNSSQWMLRKGSTTYTQGTITPYTGGDSYVKINHV